MSNTAVLNAEMNIETENQSPLAEKPLSDSIGRTLKHAREEKNMSLDEASRATKIRKEFLLALEEDRFELLPGDVFARGFVRSYADFLGLDGKAAALRAADRMPEGKVAAVAGAQAPRASGVGRIVGLAVVGAAAAAVWYFQTHGGL